MSKKERVSSLLVVLLLFAAFNGGVYLLCTRRCLPDDGTVVKTRVISLDKYLPFAQETEIYQTKAPFTLTGELPVIDGAEGLYPVFSAVVHALYPQESVHFAQGSFSGDSKLQMNNTLRAYKGVVDGSCDIAFCAMPSQSQLDYAADKGVELAFVPIGKEAFVFLVHRDNPVDSLSVEQVRGIYSGKYNNWAELGGRREPICALQRIEGSGSQSALLAFMGDTPLARPRNNFFGSAIGFSFRYYTVDVIRNNRVKVLSLGGCYPDAESIQDGSYPVVMPFYLVYNKANTNPNLHKVVDWVLSPDGQRLIQETGYTPISPVE